MRILLPRPISFGAILCSVVPLFCSNPAAAITVDGALDPEYGPALVTQTTQTTAGGYNSAIQNEASFSELDEGYATISDGTLHLFLSGNLLFYWSIEGQTVSLPVDIFLDTGAGGQNVMLANNPTFNFAYDLKKLTGLKFDSDFTAGWWLSIGGNDHTWPQLQTYLAPLPPGGGGGGTYLGLAACNGPGTLSGGTNPYGVQAALDDRDTVGVTFGCSASSGAGQTHGIEWAIPLAAIGNPTGCVKVCAFVSYGDHSQLFNQVLGPLPPGTCSLGLAGAVDFSAIPGPQYFTVCPAATPARHETWGRLKSIYR